MAIPSCNLHYVLPNAVSVEQFTAALSSITVIKEIARRQALQTYYDSFDWRLYDADMACFIVQSGQFSQLFLFCLSSGTLLGEIDNSRVPVFAGDITDAAWRDRVAPILEMRALMPVLTQPLTVYEYAVLNKRGKIVCRLFIEAFEAVIHIRLQALRGYSKALSKWAPLLRQRFDLTPVEPLSLLEPLLRQQERCNHYSSKLHLSLERGMRADAAGRQIFRRLAVVMADNEKGVIADIDSEFLHDFRVAIRKTRAGLAQLKGIFPEPTVRYYREFFSWLGQITGPVRDLDVYLLNFEDYKTGLPEAMREDLNPLYEFLTHKQRQAQFELAEYLQALRYKQGMADWEKFLTQPQKAGNSETDPPKAAMPVFDFAAGRIWRVYRRVLKQGSAIDDASPPEELHELRKSCKKLRYLMEFFQSLYPEETISALIKTLKVFQEVLGNFQDYQVQEEQLKHFSEEMFEAGIHAATFLAMGVLIEHLDQLRNGARREFAMRFADFQSAEHRQAFASLFAPKG
ncbi:MAG: CHAD domain-containing protein [Gammaproteobacteria bacterium]